MVDLALIGVAAGGLVAFSLSVARPRLFLYVILLTLPTQFFFIPVGSFFVSPADSLVLLGALGFTLRLTAGDAASWNAVVRHRWIFLMILGYLGGFVILGELSRTLVRIPMAIVPSLLATAHLKTRRSMRTALICVVAAGAGDAAYGLFRLLGGASSSEARLAAIAGVNFDAMIILSAGAVAWALWADFSKLLGAAALTASGFATLSRGGLVGFIAAFSTGVVPVLRRKGRAVALGTAIVLALVGWKVPSVQERIQSRLDEKSLDIAGGKSSIEIRVLATRAAIRAFLDRPITGIGFNSFLDYSLLDPDLTLASLGEGVYTHSTLLEVLAEGGILAAVPFFVFLGGVLAVAWVLWKRARRRRDRLSGGALAALVVVMVSGLFANIMLHYSAWATVGIALACSRLSAEETPSEPTSP